jgi:hypothetical protein
MNGDNGLNLVASFFFAVGFILTFVGIVNWLEVSSWLCQIWWLVWICSGAFIMRATFGKGRV